MSGSCVGLRSVAAAAAAAAVALCFVQFGGIAGAQSKVVVAPVAVALTEGRTQVVELRLTQPLLAPPPEAAVLSFAFSVSDPARVSLSTPTGSWTASEWAQTRSVTVTALADGVPNPSNTVEITASASTTAPFYAGVNLRVVVSLEDADPKPTTTTSTTVTGVVSPTPASVAPGSASPAIDDRGADSSTTSGSPHATREAELALTGTANSSAPLAALGAALLLAGLAMSRTAKRAAGSPARRQSPGKR
jgi:hypothetical protein